MASTAWDNGDDPFETSDEQVPKVNRDSWRFFANLDISLYIHLLADSKSLIVSDKLLACARAARKKHFCTRMWLPANAHMKTGFDNAER